MQAFAISKSFYLLAAPLLVAGIVIYARTTLITPPAGIDTLEPADIPPGTEPFMAGRTLLKPLHQEKLPTQEGDWLNRHAELGQSFLEYAASHREPLDPRMRRFRVQPIGDLSSIDLKLMAEVALFLEAFFQLPVTPNVAVPFGILPSDAERPGEYHTHRQVLTSYVNQNVLAPLKSDDAAVVLGIVVDDLWSGTGNYLFGQADLGNKVAVMSIARFGDPSQGRTEYDLCLRRAFKVAAHETGHVFGLMHCVEYECLMNGSNSLDETDRKPLEYCPSCQAKLWWALRLNPATRAEELVEFEAARPILEPLWQQERAIWRRDRSGLVNLIAARLGERAKSED